ncbi:DNA polymerase II large subunit [archaeon]|nr:DNA polymerase II large subunit [archaeon]
MKATSQIQDYYKQLEQRSLKEYSIAENAKKKGLDPEQKVEIPLATGIGDRVEGLVGPKNVAKDIDSLLKENSREQTALKIINKIINGDYGHTDEQKKADQCVRTSLTLLTEGVVAAPIEGIDSVKIEENPDSSRYLTVNFAGPIRSAGGTGQALGVLLADYTRKKLGLQEFRPTETEIERYVEEINIYHNVVSRLQYKPTDDEAKIIVRNCPICVSGTPTAKQEVNIYKNLDRFPSNRIRGGMCLVIGEGIAQKAQRLVSYTKEFGLKWDWLHSIIKIEKATPGKQIEIKPVDKYLADVVAGRPIIAYPSQQGALRLRYGRARNIGLMSKGVHPATMIVLDGFPAIGTQFKLERPGKGTTFAPCDSIEGPVVKLKDGSVKKIETIEQAEEIKEQIEEILFLGDLLISFGDFIKDNHPVMQSPWTEEWWQQELQAKNGTCENPLDVSWEQAEKYSLEYELPLHPKYIFPYNDIPLEEFKNFISWLEQPTLSLTPEKRTLEKLLVPHKIQENQVIIEEPYKTALFKTLSIGTSQEIVGRVEAKTTINLVQELSPYEIKEKIPVYIGARMGRPEKAKARLMKPAPHLLFPVGNYGGPTRSLKKACEKGVISIEVPRLKCKKCNKMIYSWTCECGTRAELDSICSKCGRPTQDECQACGGTPIAYEKRAVTIKELLNKAKEKTKTRNIDLKGVKGTISKNKMLEPIEKGLLRSTNNLHVFKDGTLRFDSTNLVLTHFKPNEIGTHIEKLKELGYTQDWKGKPIENENQVIELFPQDVVPSENAIPFFLNATKFIDQELELFYQQKSHFNAKEREDLVGLLVIGLAPHTSAGVLGRIIGFSKAHACYAHPYFHAACRRDADGDEDSLMLLMDTLINFSKHYLPATRGGKMDACLVLTTILDPSQIDDQVHRMDIVSKMPLEFYRKSGELLKPQDFKIETVSDRLGKETQYSGFGYTHETTSINSGVLQSTYTTLGSMEEKVNAQLNLGKKIRAVDEQDEAKRLLNSHFMRDIYGNLRAFGEQKFRCVKCNSKYRRVPLSKNGKCTRCGGKIILTVAEGSVKKYLKVSQRIAEQYGLSDYMKQRLTIVEKNIESVFNNEKVREPSLTEFM